VRSATPADVADILSLVHALARYERAAGAVEMTEAALGSALFGAEPRVFALVAEDGGTVVGMAVYFFSFSTWTGRHGLYLEDLFVLPEHRRRGAGRSLMAALAATALAAGCRRLEWAVLDWNEPAIDFYKSLGAVPMEEWTVFRLSGAALAGLASGRSPQP
jgi:GNAT superfamily N-acetyltransferase